MNEESILSLIKNLNKDEVLPEYALRKNSIYYTFVSYINNSIACFMSENYNGTILFINRAYKEMKELNVKNDINNDNLKYFAICQKYFKITAEFLVANKLIDEFFIEKVNKMNFSLLN